MTFTLVPMPKSAVRWIAIDSTHYAVSKRELWWRLTLVTKMSSVGPLCRAEWKRCRMPVDHALQSVSREATS